MPLNVLYLSVVDLNVVLLRHISGGCHMDMGKNVEVTYQSIYAWHHETSHMTI
jgi:hypothetical protein